ncbi:hypothetical protein Emed_005187 [Eimeria media]
MKGAPAGAPQISEEEWLLQAIAAATEDGGLRVPPGLSHLKASTTSPPPSAATAAALRLPSIGQGDNSGGWAGIKSFPFGGSLETGLGVTSPRGPLGAPTGLVHLSEGEAPGVLAGNEELLNTLEVEPSLGPLVREILEEGGLSAQSIGAPFGAFKSASTGLISNPLEALLGAPVTENISGSCWGQSLESLLEGGPLGAAVSSPAAASAATAHHIPAQQSSGLAPQKKTHVQSALASPATAAPPALEVLQEGRDDLQQPQTASHHLGLGGHKEASPGVALITSGQTQGDTGALKGTEASCSDLVEPLPRSFLDSLSLDELLSSEEIAAYEASVRSNCLLWLPLERRQVLLVPGLVLYTYLQNLSVSSKFIFCLSPSARQAVELQTALQQALAVIPSPGGTYEGPLSKGPQGLIVRLPASREGRDTAAARLVERYWRQKKLRVKWGAPSTWEQYREALKEYSEAVRELEGIGEAVPKTETEKQRYNLQRLLAPFRFAPSQLEALKAVSRMSERPATPPARAPHQEPPKGPLDSEASCSAPNEWEETIPEEALLQWPRVFVATPSVFTTLLMHGFVRLEDVALLLLDCACSSSSSSNTQPYARLLEDFFSRAAAMPRILSLIRGPIGGQPEVPLDLRSTLRRLRCSTFLLAEPLGPAGGPPDLRICRYTPEPVVDTAKQGGLREHYADAVGGSSNTSVSVGSSRHCLLKVVSFCLSVCDRWLDAAVQAAPERASFHDPLSALSKEFKETTTRDELLDAALSGIEGHPLVRANTLCMRGVVALLSPGQRKKAAARWKHVKEKLLYVQQEWGLWCVFVAAERLRQKLNRFAVSLCGSPLYAEEMSESLNPTALSPLAWASLTNPPETHNFSGEDREGKASLSSSTRSAALPSWLSWPFGEALRLEGSNAYLPTEPELSLTSYGIFVRPDPLLLQRRLQVGLGFVFLELLGGVVRKHLPYDLCATLPDGLQGLTTSLEGLSQQQQQQNQGPLQQQQQQQQPRQCAKQCDGVIEGALQGLFSSRLLELDRVLCRLLAQDRAASWGEDPQNLPSLEYLQREGGVLVLCSNNTAVWCLTSFLVARGFGHVVDGSGRACKADFLGASSSFIPRQCVSLKHTSLRGRGDGVPFDSDVDYVSPLRLTVSSSVREVLNESSPAGFGLVIMTETPDTEGDLLRAVAACRKPPSRATRASAGPSLLLLLAPDDCPEDSHSSPTTHCRWAAPRRSTRRFELYDLLRRIQHLRRCAGGETLLPGEEGDTQKNASSAVSLQQQKGGVLVPTTGAFVPPSLAWSFLQQVLTAAYGEAACEAYRAARGPSASACFNLGPLKMRREHVGAPSLEIPPLKGFRKEPLLPQVLEVVDFPAVARGPHGAEEMRPPCNSWREPWERLAVQALQRLHAAGVLNDHLLLKPIAPFEAETDDAINDKTASKRDGGVASLERSWRLLPEGLLAPQALNHLLLKGESTDCCIQLYVHRVWCTPVTRQQMQREQQWQEQQQQEQHEAAASDRASEKPHSSSKADVPLPCSPVYESGGLLGYWSPFSSKHKSLRTETANAGEAEAEAKADATKAAAVELLTKLFPHKPISSVLQPLALLLPSALPEPVVFYGLHPMGLCRGPLFPGTEGSCEGPSEHSDSEDEDGGPLENSSSEADSEGEPPEAFPGEEGLMRIEIDPPTDDEMILRIPSAAALKALLVFTHDMLLRDVAVSNFRPFVGKLSEVNPFWGALFAAASRCSPSSSSCGGQVKGPQQQSSATLRLYAANDEEALAYLDGIYLQQDEAAAAETATTPSATSTDLGTSNTTEEEPQSTNAAGSRKESVLQLLLKAGVRDIRRILLPFFAVAPLAWDGKGLDLAYLCTQRLLACFAASSKWHPQDASRSLMETYGEEALRDSVRSLGAPVLASELIASALRRLTESEAPSSSTFAADGDVPSPLGAQADDEAAAEIQTAEARAEAVAEDLLFSASSPLARVGMSLPLEEFCRAGGMGGGRGPFAPLTGAESLHPQKGLYVFKALAARGLERPVLRLTHDEKRSYRYVALQAVDTQNTPWGPRGPSGAGGPLLSDVYKRELSHAGVHLLEPHPDPLRGPHGNCWLLRGPRIRQANCSRGSSSSSSGWCSCCYLKEDIMPRVSLWDRLEDDLAVARLRKGCRALFRDDKGGGAPSADPDAAYAPQFARLCPWTEPVFHQLTWLAPAFYRVEAAASQWELRSFVLEEIQLTTAEGSRCRLGKSAFASRCSFSSLTHQRLSQEEALLYVAARQLDSRLLSAALTTPAARQPGDVDSEGPWWHSQRLELLGDAVLQFVVSLYLFLCRQEGDTEGMLTDKRSKFVSNAHLSASAKKAGFSHHILVRPFSPSTTLLDLRRQCLSSKMQADAVEALIASIYLSNASFLAAHSHSSSNSSSSSSTTEPQQGSASCTPLHLRGPLVTQEAPRSFGGLVAAASFIDRFIVRGSREVGAPDADEAPAASASEILPPAVSIITAAAAVCRRCCRSSADQTTNVLEREFSTLERPSEDPLLPSLLLDEAEARCILWPLEATGQETPESRLDSCSQIRSLLQQLTGALGGNAYREAISAKEEGKTQTDFSVPPPAPHASGSDFLLDRRLPQYKASHKEVSDMWLACARRASNGCPLTFEEPQSHEAQLPKERQKGSQEGSHSFWSERHLNLRLVALARTVQAEPGTLGAPSKLGALGSYELLEFVGDSLLGYLVIEWLFCLFPSAREGALTMAKSILLSNAFFAAKLIRRMHAAGLSLDSLPLGDSEGPEASVPCACEGLVVGVSQGGDSWEAEGGRSLLSVLWKQAAAAGCGAGRPCCCCCYRCSKLKRDRVEELLLALPPEEDFAREAKESLSHRTAGVGLLRAADTPESDSRNSPKWIKQLGDIYESLACATFFSGFSPQATWETLAEDFESCRPQLAAFLAAAQSKGDIPEQQGCLPLDD